jgi:hypothetical protein
MKQHRLIRADGTETILDYRPSFDEMRRLTEGLSIRRQRLATAPFASREPSTRSMEMWSFSMIGASHEHPQRGTDT